ncbi:MAG: DUF58 domain-containing protein [Rhodanobacteraceae bacterium]
MSVAGLRTRILQLAERRLPALTRLREPEALPLRLNRRRIYVLPTRFGLGFGVLLFVMLLGALNYGNNPAFLLTCFLGAAAWASLFFGFRAMSGLAITQMRADEAHVGDSVKIHMTFAAGARNRPGLRLRCRDHETAFSARASDDTPILLALPCKQRGWFRAGRLRIWTDYPLGLFQCWSWVNPALEFLIYPKAEHPAPPLPPGAGRVGERASLGDSEDYAGLRDYRSSDPPRLIAWKASARHETLLVREVERRAGTALVLDYAALGALDPEARISRLTAWVLAAGAAQCSYLLRLPGLDIGPDSGSRHRSDSLRALALFKADRTR